MTRFAIKKHISPLEEREYERSGMLDLHKKRLTQLAVNELAEAMFNTWAGKEFKRDSLTGSLVLTFDAEIIEDADIERWKALGRAEGRAIQRRIDRENMPYGLDEVYE